MEINQINQIILLSVLLIFFVYYGGKYVPTVLKQNKEILVGVVGGLVLCVFLKSRVEGVCSVDNRDIDKVERDCGDLDSIPDNCPSERCAETLVSWFNGNEPGPVGERSDRCDGTEPIFREGTNDPFYIGLQNLTSSCETLLMTDLDTLRSACPEGISMDSSVSCGCALKEYINKFNDNRNVGDSFWSSPDINKILKDLLTDRGPNPLIRELSDEFRTPDYIRRIYNRSDLICTSPKGPNAPTPTNDRSVLNTRSCINRYPAAIDNSWDDEEPSRTGRNCNRIDNRDDITNIDGECTVGELMTLDQYMNCSCSGSGENGLRLKGGEVLGGRYNYQAERDAPCSGPFADNPEEGCPYTARNYPYDYESSRGVGVHDNIRGWNINQGINGRRLSNYNYGSGIYTCRSGSGIVEDFISIPPETERDVREICEVNVEYKIDKPPQGGYQTNDDGSVPQFMPFSAQYDTTMNDAEGNPGWIPCICPDGTKNRPPVITQNDDGTVSVTEDPLGGTVVEKLPGSQINRGDGSKYEIKSVKCTPCTNDEIQSGNC